MSPSKLLILASITPCSPFELRGEDNKYLAISSYRSLLPYSGSLQFHIPLSHGPAAVELPRTPHFLFCNPLPEPDDILGDDEDDDNASRDAEDVPDHPAPVAIAGIQEGVDVDALGIVRQVCEPAVHGQQDNKPQQVDPKGRIGPREE